jgi:hypothetical protein
LGKKFLECGGLAAAFYGVSECRPAYRLGASTHRAKQIALSSVLTPRKREQDSRTPKRLAPGAALHAASFVIDSRDITDVRTAVPSWTLMLLVPPVLADFEVCPLRPEITGERQPVCIESTKNIFIQHDE